jgi:hypothetical protein
MSSGEKAFFDLYSRIYFAYHKIIEENDKVKIIYLLIDEGDLGFHPQWQKGFIKNLLEFLNYLSPGIKVQVILTTHSPVLVSDLPSANAIFFKKEGNKVTVRATLEEHKETFGANIHTLYTDSFFVSGGLVGDFAKGKLDEVIDLLNKKENKQQKEYERRLIKLVDEPIIKRKLEKMWYEKYGLDEEIAAAELLLKRLKELRGDTN